MAAATVLERQERYIRLNRVPKDLAHMVQGPFGKPIHGSGVYRWALYGLKGANGERIKLRTIRAGGGMATTSTWLREFFEALSTPAGAPIAESHDLNDADADAILAGAGM